MTGGEPDGGGGWHGNGRILGGRAIRGGASVGLRAGGRGGDQQEVSLQSVLAYLILQDRMEGA